jgi:epoxyqueuosine reductase
VKSVVDRSEDTGAGDAAIDLSTLAADIKRWGQELGFGAVGISDLDAAEPAERLRRWLQLQRHGEMQYMLAREPVRADPQALLAGAVRSICVRMDYRPRDDGKDWVEREWGRLADGHAAVVSIYARGRDYHKAVRA